MLQEQSTCADTKNISTQNHTKTTLATGPNMMALKTSQSTPSFSAQKAMIYGIKEMGLQYTIQSALHILSSEINQE
jgi:hypothetical protein